MGGNGKRDAVYLLSPVSPHYFSPLSTTYHRHQHSSPPQHEEHVISIIVSLLRNCRPNQRTRLLNKFTENDHEKVDRLLELHFKYLEKVLATNYALEEQAKVGGE